MTEKEKRDLDAWIAIHIFKAKRHHTPFDTWEGGLDCLVSDFNPSDDSALAMAVLKKCAEKIGKDADTGIGISGEDDAWCVTDGYGKFEGQASTLETAICLFAKRLYSK